METAINKGRKTWVASISEYAALKGVSVHRVEDWVQENRITTLRQQGKTLIDVDASEKLNEAKQTTLDENELLTPEVLLQRLLEKAEVSAQKSDISRKKWQLLSLVSLMFLAATLYVTIWIYMDTRALPIDQIRLRMDNQALTEQLHSANTEISDLSRQHDLLINTNSQLVAENANLKARNSSPSTRVESLNQPNQSAENIELINITGKSTALESNWPKARGTPQDQSRLNAIRKGIYPQDITKAELITALGKPDRVYKGKLYEQLVYFDRSPGCFWFKNGSFLKASE
jgi:regulator of replication initiation timing